MKAQFVNGKCLKPYRFHLRNEEEFDMNNYHHLWNCSQLESPQALRDFILESDGLTSCEQRAYKLLADWHSGALQAKECYDHVVNHLTEEEQKIYNNWLYNEDYDEDFHKLVPKAGDFYFKWKELEKPWKEVLTNSDFKERVSSYDWVLNDSAAEWYGEHFVHDPYKARKLIKRYARWIQSGGWKTAKTGWVRKCGFYLSKQDVEEGLENFIKHSSKSCPKRIDTLKRYVMDFDYEVDHISDQRREWLRQQGI